MNTSQLQCILTCDPVLQHRTLGVFAADQLPVDLPSHPCGFIANTDVRSKPGQHWLAFFIQSNIIECFDSYGQHPGIYNGVFTSWIIEHTKTVLVNGQRLQSDTSNVCGLYCIYFLHQRLLGKSMNQIVCQFSRSDFEGNDHYILNLMLDVFPDCVTNNCVYSQTCQPLFK